MPAVNRPCSSVSIQWRSAKVLPDWKKKRAIW